MLIKGLLKKTLEVQGDKIIIKQARGIFQAETVKTILINKISAVELQKPRLLSLSGYGFLQLTLSGGIEKNNFDVINDENSVCFRDMEIYSQAEIIKHYIENFKKSNSQTTSSFSVADEILKLKNLYDLDIISKEEFENKKTNLLK
jgi:hypothetical protein